MNMISSHGSMLCGVFLFIFSPEKDEVFFDFRRLQEKLSVMAPEGDMGVGLFWDDVSSRYHLSNMAGSEEKLQ